MNKPQSQGSQGNSQLDITLGLLQGGLDSAVDMAGNNVLGWIKTLQGASQLAAVSAELQKLHDVLSSGSTDARALATSLSTLGEHTTKAAAGATPDAQEKLRMLGQVLSAAAHQLRG